MPDRENRHLFQTLSSLRDIVFCGGLTYLYQMDNGFEFRLSMLRIDTARWGQTLEDLRHLATSAPHPRTRERFLALYEITQASCATRVAPHTQRHPQTVMGWVHAYNEHGPAALAYRRTGGRPPFARGLPRPWRQPSARRAARPPRPR
jgi:hypothetical protein